MSNAYTDEEGVLESTESTAAVQCPHCVASGEEEWKTWIVIDRKEFNCKIFRHGALREPYERARQMVPIPPHAPQHVCDQLAAQGQIIGGCGKPYKLEIMQEEGKTVVRAVVCGYV